jgi:hypothetical protein
MYKFFATVTDAVNRVKKYFLILLHGLSLNCRTLSLHAQIIKNVLVNLGTRNENAMMAHTLNRSKKKLISAVTAVILTLMGSEAAES